MKLHQWILLIIYVILSALMGYGLVINYENNRRIYLDSIECMHGGQQLGCPMDETK